MKLIAVFAWILIVGVVLASCGPSDAPSSEGAQSSADSADEAASQPSGSEEEVFIEPTPMRTATPSPLDESVTEFAESVGIGDVIFLGLTGVDWINIMISVLIVVLGYAIGSLVVRLLIRRFSSRAPPPYDKRIHKRLGPPLRQLVAIYFLRIATVRLEFVGFGLKTALTDLYFVLALVLGIEFFLRAIDLVREYQLDQIEDEDRRAEVAPMLLLLVRVADAVVIIIAISVGLARFGINITALAAALGVAGLGVALAAQSTISDWIAGLLILADRPFRVGDRIEISEIGTWGDVIDIGIRTTRIRTRDNRLVIIPNSTIGDSEVINYSYPDPTYRVETHMSIAYGADIRRVQGIMLETVRGIEGVLQDKPVDALYVEVGDSAMIFRVRWWIDSFEDTRGIFSEIHTALHEALNKAEIEIPYPKQDLQVTFKPNQNSQLPTDLIPGDGSGKQD